MIKTNVRAIIRKEKINVKSVIAKANKAITQPNIIAKIPVTMEPPYTAKSTHKGMWIEVSSLNPTDKKNYIKAFACFMFGAVLLGIHLAEVGFLGDDALNQIPEPWLLIIRTLMIALFFIGAFFHYKFTITQDDLFKSYQSACFVGGALGFLVFGLSLTALSPYFNFYPTFYEYFLAFAIGTSIGGYSFYRKYIAES